AVDRRQGQPSQCPPQATRRHEATGAACSQAIASAGTTTGIAGRAGSYSALPRLRGETKPLQEPASQAIASAGTTTGMAGRARPYSALPRLRGETKPLQDPASQGITTAGTTQGNARR